MQAVRRAGDASADLTDAAVGHCTRHAGRGAMRGRPHIMERPGAPEGGRLMTVMQVSAAGALTGDP